MINFEQEQKKAYKKVIADFLRERIKNDKAIETACRKSEKTLDGIVAYIFKNAKSQAEDNVACIADAEVFGWVIHYLIEDSVDLAKENTPQKREEKKPNLYEQLEMF